MGADDRMKQVIIMRTDLNMRKGKMIAQGAHATWLFFLRGGPMIPSEIDHWFMEGMKKICVRADSEAQLLELHRAAIRAGLRAYIVTDAGHTEFDGIPTMTCLAIGPNEDEAVDKITGSLTLL